MQGSAAGVSVISSGGQPGDNPSIYIRGIGSINASTQPLIVLDGVPYSGNINNITQDQVESMTLLKDASSTALYGSRAANGVIVITTKSGKRNSKPTVNMTSLVGVSAPAVELYKKLGAAEYLEYAWQGLKNKYQYTDNNTEAEARQKATNELIDNLKYNPTDKDMPVGIDGKLVPGTKLLWDTDWEKAILNKAAFKQEHRFDVSGGSSDTRYFISADYLNMNGSVKTSNFERVGVRMNLDSKANNWLDVGLKSAYTSSEQIYPTQSGATYASAIQWINSVANIYPLYRRDENGNFVYDAFGGKIYDYGNNGIKINQGRPLYENENAVGALYNNQSRIRRYSFLANGYAEAHITKDFSLKSQLGYEQYARDDYGYTNYLVGAASSVSGRVSQYRNLGKTVNFTNSANYNAKFGNHGLTAQGIFEVYQFTYDYLGAQGTGFLPNVYELNGSTKPESVAGYVNRERMVSYLARLAYDYNNKYFIEGSFRRDGSSKFSPETRWGNFYSFGGSWMISNENFLKGSKVLNQLKLRASYGELGNNSGIGYFPYLSLFDTGWNQLDNTGVLLGSISDYLLTWEKTASSNIGLDFGFFNNRISGNIDYFVKKSVDLIYSKPLPGSTGNTSITTNVGSIKNYGVEFTVNTKNIKAKNFTWNSNFNISFVKNRITELTQKSFLNGSKRWEVGKSLYDFFIPVWLGVDSEDGMGVWQTKTIEADGMVTYGKTKNYTEANSETNREYVGSSLPDFTGGFSNYFKWGNFDLNALFNFSFGSYIYDGQYAGLMSGFSTLGYQQSVDVKNAWTKPGDNTNVPINIVGQNNNNSTSTRFLFKNDYIRLKSLTFGYNIPKELTSSFGVSNFRIFLQADNVWTWQTHKGIDPEQSIAGTTNNRSYNLKTISLGLNLNF
ncbi:TonB-linked outer membrane protein, SusC/RagA family [Riemerella columbipharyngis]|uniref:TonB-linked outer membrane protein, SusC/RagA family n=1 Tax=Riemerella columbipharyngis TaxID=1071918 RepID=A0A1G7C4W2_9FLAO|nr:TonB-linked outer membrane protein, SusC/RagA family [Riemerella columbipharyngis]